MLAERCEQAACHVEQQQQLQDIWQQLISSQAVPSGGTVQALQIGDCIRVSQAGASVLTVMTSLFIELYGFVCTHCYIKPLVEFPNFKARCRNQPEATTILPAMPPLFAGPCN